MGSFAPGLFALQKSTRPVTAERALTTDFRWFPEHKTGWYLFVSMNRGASDWTECSGTFSKRDIMFRRQVIPAFSSFDTAPQ